MKRYQIFHGVDGKAIEPDLEDGPELRKSGHWEPQKMSRARHFGFHYSSPWTLNATVTDDTGRDPRLPSCPLVWLSIGHVPCPSWLPVSRGSMSLVFGVLAFGVCGEEAKALCVRRI